MQGHDVGLTFMRRCMYIIPADTWRWSNVVSCMSWRCIDVHPTHKRHVADGMCPLGCSIRRKYLFSCETTRVSNRSIRGFTIGSRSSYRNKSSLGVLDFGQSSAKEKKWQPLILNIEALLPDTLYFGQYIYHLWANILSFFFLNSLWLLLQKQRVDLIR